MAAAATRLLRRWAPALPAFALLAVFFVWPLLTMLGLSLDAPHWSARLYAAFLRDPVDLAIVLRTLAITLAVTTVTLALAYPTAYCIASAPAPRRRVMVVCVVVPYLTSLLVRTYAWVVLLGDQGPINALLLRLGWIADPLPLLYSRFGMLVGMVQVMLPLMILPLLGSMLRIDEALLRAGRSLGAGGLRLFVQVYLPQTLPGLRGGCTLVFVIALGFYIIPMALGGIGDVMVSNLIAQQISSANDFGMASVMGFALLALAAVSLALARLPQAAWRRPGAGRESPLARWSTRASGAFWRARRGRRRARWRIAMPAVRLVGMATLAMLMLPSLVVLAASFGGDDLLSFPPTSLSLRWYRNFFTSADWLDPAALSLRIAALSACAALGCGTLAAIALDRMPPGRARRWAGAAMLAPLVIPPIVLAIGSFTELAQWGWIGNPFALAMVHACGGIPLVLVIVGAGLERLDPRLERAAASLGAGRWTRFRRVVMPLLAPSLLAAGLFAFIHSFDEVVVTSFIAGTQARTLPLKMFEDIRNQVDPTIAAVSGLLILLPLLGLPWLRPGLRSGGAPG